MLLLKQCVAKEMSYEGGCKAFTEMTGIEASNFERLRCIGDRDTFNLGDWEYDRGHMTNAKTGEVLELKQTGWKNTTTHTVPASNGSLVYINSYDDGSGTKVQFKYGDDENIAPTSANVTVNGKSKTINYNPKYRVDTEIYNYLEK